MRPFEVIMVLGLLVLWLGLCWILSNVKTDSDGYGCCGGLVLVCCLCPWAIPIWLLKYWLGYWGDTSGHRYYSWFNRGRGYKNKPEFFSDKVDRWAEKLIK